MLTFKQYIEEMNDNPDKKAVVSQVRDTIIKLNKPNLIQRFNVELTEPLFPFVMNLT